MIQTKISGDLGADLQRFADKISGEVLKAGAGAMSAVIREEVALNASRHVKTGNLYNAVYQYRAEDRSTEDKKTYLVSISRKKAPHWHLLEFGHFQRYKVIPTRDGGFFTDKSQTLATPKWIPPIPIVRPALDAMDRAMDRARERMAEELAKGAK